MKVHALFFFFKVSNITVIVPFGNGFLKRDSIDDASQ